MRYVQRDLNFQQVQDLITSRDFIPLTPISGEPRDPHVIYSSSVPAGRNTRSSTLVYIQQTQVPGISKPLSRFTISIQNCGGGGPSCLATRDRAERASQSVSNQRMPLDGMRISGVLFGDANRDGLTDVLVQFSNGAATLYQAREDSPRLSPPVAAAPVAE